MFRITSRMLLLLKRANGGLTAAEMARIMGLSYEDVCYSLAIMRSKGAVNKRETNVGFEYTLTPKYADAETLDDHD